MKKFLSFAAYALLAVALPLSFASCGSDDDEEDKDKTEKPEKPSTDTKTKTPKTSAEAQKMLWGAWEREEAMLGDEYFDGMLTYYSEAKYFHLYHIREGSKQYLEYVGKWVKLLKAKHISSVELTKTDPSCVLTIIIKENGPSMPFYIYEFTSDSYVAGSESIHYRKLEALPEYVDLSGE
ncbi:MAG: hypothetical protein J6M53_09160 [Bacteroidaceae bacterium]|nr:hypothetical protein [Bacteroidaceae bacterium]